MIEKAVEEVLKPAALGMKELGRSSRVFYMRV